MDNDIDVVETYMDNYFGSYEGERGVENLGNLCEVLGYGEGWMQGRALEDFLTDNPGAVEAVVEWMTKQIDRSPDWQGKIREFLEDEGHFAEDETQTEEVA